MNPAFRRTGDVDRSTSLFIVQFLLSEFLGADFRSVEPHFYGGRRPSARRLAMML